MEDFGVDDLGELEPAATRERENVPEGTHELKIVRVTNQPYGFDLALQHDDQRYGWVFHRMDRDRSQTAYRLRELRNALAISPDEWRSLDPTEIVDRRLRAEIRHNVDAKGRLWVNVWKYMPSAELEQPATPATPKAPRTAAAKVKSASPAIGSDDIPF